LRTQSALKLTMLTLCLMFSSGTAALELSWETDINDQSHSSPGAAAGDEDWENPFMLRSGTSRRIQLEEIPTNIDFFAK